VSPKPSRKDEHSGLVLLPTTDVYGRIAPAATWEFEGDTLVGHGQTVPWCAVLGPQTPAANFRLAASLTIQLPSPEAPPAGSPRERPCIAEGNRYRYFAGEYAPGSDAAIFFRYHDRSSYYRLEFSTRHREVVLWHSCGGYLRVAPFPVQLGCPIAVEVLAEGPQVVVRIDGKETLVYAEGEPQDQIPGSFAFAVYGATTAFHILGCEDLGSPVSPTSEAAHEPKFSFRRWRDQMWLWDGQEPIACFEARLTQLWGFAGTAAGTQPFLSHLKLRPSRRPQLWSRLSWGTGDLSGEGLLVGRAEDVEVEGQGTACPELRFRTAGLDGALPATHCLKIGYDAANHVYRYEMDQTLTFPKNGSWFMDRLANVSGYSEDSPVGSRDNVKVEIADPYPYNSKTAGQGVENPWLAAGHQWAILRGDDGRLYRIPINHVLDFKYNDNHWMMHPDESFYVLGPDPIVSPKFEFRNHGMPMTEGTCTWGYDYHFCIADLTWDWLLQGVELRSEYCITGLPNNRAQKLLAESSIHPSFVYADDDREDFSLTPDVYAFPVARSPQTDFAELHSVCESQPERVWIGNYEMDPAIGRERPGSMRLVGPSRAVGEIPEYQMDPTAERYLLRAWVKTRGVTGTGPAIGLRETRKSTAGDWLVPGLLGDNDWQELRLVGAAPRSGQADICLQLDGDGTAWFTDVELRSLGSDEAAPTPMASIPLPPAWEGPFFRLKCDEGAGQALHDASGHRHSARLYGPTWRDDDGPCVLFDGEDDFAASWTDPVRSWQDPAFTEATGLSIGAWVKPGPIREPVRQVLLSHDTSYELFLEGRGPYYLGVRLRLKEPKRHRRDHHDLELATPALVPADRWTHMAATITRGAAELYIGGKRILSRPMSGWIRYYNSPEQITPAIYLGGRIFWDGITSRRVRHHYRGGMRDVRVYTRYLTESEVRSEWALA
jgi:hypothetical protein